MFDKIKGLFKPQKKESKSQLDDFWFSALTEAGVEVTPENALKVSAIWACNKVISETMAVLPFLTYE